MKFFLQNSNDFFFFRKPSLGNPPWIHVNNPVGISSEISLVIPSKNLPGISKEFLTGMPSEISLRNSFRNSYWGFFRKCIVSFRIFFKISCTNRGIGSKVEFILIDFADFATHLVLASIFISIIEPSTLKKPRSEEAFN